MLKHFKVCSLNKIALIILFLPALVWAGPPGKKYSGLKKPPAPLSQILCLLANPALYERRLVCSAWRYSRLEATGWKSSVISHKLVLKCASTSACL